MTDVPTTNSDTGASLVSDEHCPESAQEAQTRALFLTAGLGILSSKILRSYMDHCDSKHMSDPTQKGVSTTLTIEQYSEAVKELLSISIWLTLFEQAHEDIPEWFKEFILNCHRISDKLQAKPTAKELQTKYNLNNPLPEICQEVSVNLCMQLDLGGTVNDALLYLGHLLEMARPNRLDLLSFALKEPISKLDERIKAG